MRSTRRSLCAAMLSLQAIVLFLTGVVTIGLTDIGAAASLSLGGGLALLCVLAAGLLRSRVGYVLGWAIQVVSIALGFVSAPMFFLGVVFAVLWGVADVGGARIDREKAERAVLEEEWRAAHDGGPAPRADPGTGPAR